jgi:hypothetical protein
VELEPARSPEQLVGRRTLSFNGYNFYEFMCIGLSIDVDVAIRKIGLFRTLTSPAASAVPPKAHTAWSALSQQIRGD